MGLADSEAGPATASLSGRSPAASVTAEFLHAHDELAERPLWRRILGLSPLSVESRSLFWDVMGELEVGRALAQLGEEWTVFHSVPLGPDVADIDHLAVGPGGVFTINTRNHTGQLVAVAGRSVTASGHRLPHVRHSELELGHAEALLSEATGLRVTAHAILVIVDPEQLHVSESPRDVAVLTSHQLARWLSRRPPVLEQSEVALIVRSAEQEKTWRPKLAVLGDGALHSQRFEKIRREVAAARFIRQMWVLGLSIALLGALIVAGSIHFAAL